MQGSSIISNVAALFLVHHAPGAAVIVLNCFTLDSFSLVATPLIHSYQSLGVSPVVLGTRFYGLPFFRMALFPK